MRRFDFDRATLIVALIGTCAALVGGCPMNSGDGVPDDGSSDGFVDVSIANFAYSPNEITITRGQTVRWTNNERAAIPHTVTSGNPGDADAGAAFGSDDLNSGQQFTHTFDQTGEFVYYCIPHQFMSSMRGARVTVTE